MNIMKGGGKIKKIIICLNPFESHFFPTISLAKHALNVGHEVIYMGFSTMEDIIKKEGFQYISLPSCTDKNINDLKKRKSYKELELLYLNLHDEILAKFINYNPDIILMGISRFQLYLVPALSYGAKVYLYSLCGGSPWINKDSPPITSDFAYTLKAYQRAINLGLWFKRFLRKGINPEIIYERMFYPWTTMRHICRKKKIKWRFGIDGFFPDFPVLTFGTKYMEYSKIEGLSFMGLCVNETKTNNNCVEPLSLTRPIIYCSLGTMNHRYRKAETFYRAIIALFIENPQWTLVLSIGKTKNLDLSNVTDNIIIYEFAPQLYILKNADLVITHGGYGTIKECIKYAVPMIVLPCSYDQRGNAARVQFHQIGLKDSMLKTTIVEKRFGVNTRNITPENIKLLIEKVLSNPTYKINITNLRKKVEMENELVEGFNKIFR